MVKFLCLFSFLLSAYFLSAQINWAFSIDGWNRNCAKKITQDVYGDLIVTGEYNDDITDFDPSSSTFNLSANGNKDVFLAKYNESKDFVWALKIGAYYNEEVHNVTTDSLGNIYVTGSFIIDISFTPDNVPDTYFQSTTDGPHGFLVKYDKNGIYNWSVILDDGISVCKSATLDQLGNVYITGNIQNTVDMDSDSTGEFNITSNGEADIFVAKYDAEGNFGWAFNVGAYGGNYGYNFLEGGNDIIYNNGFLYLTGGFVGSNPDFNPLTGVSYPLSCSGMTNPFLAK